MIGFWRYLRDEAEKGFVGGVFLILRHGLEFAFKVAVATAAVCKVIEVWRS